LPEHNDLSIIELFEKLRLSENGQLKRSAIILFGKDPGKFYPNISVKIGKFGKNDADLLFQETEEGNLITLLQEVLNQLNRKFLTRSIEFSGMHRIEKGEYPLAAIREMLLNALVHRNYMGAPIQIRIYDNKINIWNEGTLPDGLSIESLKRSHSSKPRNPIMAEACFKGGYIDAWGRGTLKIIEACKDAHLPEPELIERDGGFLVTLFKNTLSIERLIKLGLNDRQIKAVEFLNTKNKITNSEYQTLNNTSDRTALRDLEELVTKGVFIKEGEKKGSQYKLSFGG
jgi:ATP-dependent DNA helicase RecG